MNTHVRESWRMPVPFVVLSSFGLEMEWVGGLGGNWSAKMSVWCCSFDPSPSNHSCGFGWNGVHVLEFHLSRHRGAGDVIADSNSLEGEGWWREMGASLYAWFRAVATLYPVDHFNVGDVK